MLLLELIQLPAQRSGRAQHYDGDDRDNSGQHGRLRLRAADEVPAERQERGDHYAIGSQDRAPDDGRPEARLTIDRADLCAQQLATELRLLICTALHAVQVVIKWPIEYRGHACRHWSSAMCSLAVLCGDLDKLSSYRFVWNVTEPALALGKNLRPRRPSPPREIGKLRRIEGTVLLVNAGNHVTF